MGGQVKLEVEAGIDVGFRTLERREQAGADIKDCYFHTLTAVQAPVDSSRRDRAEPYSRSQSTSPFIRRAQP